MPFDSESPGERRGSRPLGRGLEEISHLFLSHPQPASPPVVPAAPPVSVVARPGPSLSRSQLVAALKERRNELADAMLAIGPGIACSPYGEIDLFALDRAQQLTLIDVQTTLDDGLLARGLGHLDWAARNLRTVQRVFPGWAIDVSRPPRLVLVAPRFSLALRSGIRQIAGPSISCFRYCELEISGQAAILVERV